MNTSTGRGTPPNDWRIQITRSLIVSVIICEPCVRTKLE